MFMLLGPNTTLAHSSQVVMIEAQIAHVLDALKHMEKRGLASVEVRPEAQAAFTEWVDSHLDGSVWNTGGCRSWYLDGNGRNTSIWPTYTWRFRRQVKRFDVTSYQLVTSVGADKHLEHAVPEPMTSWRVG
jgi:hypothetical protein